MRHHSNKAYRGLFVVRNVLRWLEHAMIGITGMVAGTVGCMRWNVWRTRNDRQYVYTSLRSHQDFIHSHIYPHTSLHISAHYYDAQVVDKGSTTGRTNTILFRVDF